MKCVNVNIINVYKKNVNDNDNDNDNEKSSRKVQKKEIVLTFSLLMLTEQTRKARKCYIFKNFRFHEINTKIISNLYFINRAKIRFLSLITFSNKIYFKFT